jgi:hypothetical protein
VIAQKKEYAAVAKIVAVAVVLVLAADGVSTTMALEVGGVERPEDDAGGECEGGDAALEDVPGFWNTFMMSTLAILDGGGICGGGIGNIDVEPMSLVEVASKTMRPIWMACR